jgi:SAM-dependent methyltransferase
MGRFLVPVHMPKAVYDVVRKAKRVFLPKSVQEEQTPLNDLSGDRDIEWSYIAARLPPGDGYVFDFGFGNGNMSMLALQKGHRVMALDLEPNSVTWVDPSVEFVSGDLLKLDFPEHAFDFVLNCSTTEHVGLQGRYGVAFDDTDGDLSAMQKLRKLLKASGKMLMTIPCGQDAVMVPWHRVYGRERLPKLLDGFGVEEQVYWMKRADNRWYRVGREEALSYPPTTPIVPTTDPTRGPTCCYALGCFVLTPSSAEEAVEPKLGT